MTPSVYIDRQMPLLVRQLQRLVRFATVNPPGEFYEPITALLTSELKALGLDACRFAVPARLHARLGRQVARDFPRFNVLGKWQVPGATKTVHFNAHYDVVPVSGKWIHGSPFSGTTLGHWIYGRGTADMKGSIASLLLGLRALRETRTNPKVNVEVSFTADEETDSELGSGWLVRHAPLKADYAVVMEGGEKNTVCCGHNGVLWFEVTVHGRAAHGSRPDLGVNALEKMAGLVLALGDYKRQLARQKLIAPDGRKLIPTINVGGIFAPGPGGKINTVPSLATFTIDRRVLATENHVAAEAGLRAALAAAAARVPDCRITVNKISENFACFTPPEDPFFKAMAASVTRVRREPTAFNISTGFNDMHFFAHHLKIPTLGHGPGGENEHAVDERAPLRELRNSAKIYADILTTFAA